jgi:phenylacetate-CoA ligase
VHANLAELYGHAPVWAQHVLCTLEGLRLRRERFSDDFDARLARAEARSGWTDTQLAAHRLVRLRAMLVHAGARVPYYRELFAQHGFTPARLQHPDELAALPSIDKHTVVREGLLADALPHGVQPGAIVMHTSGTTGAGLRVVSSIDGIREQWAACWRYRSWHGLTRELWCATFGGRVLVDVGIREPPYWRVNLAGRQVLMSSYHLGPATAPAYLEMLRERAIPWIHGYTSMVTALAEAAIDLRASLPALRFVTFASESVSLAQRARVRDAFGIEPREHYAQTECVANFSECRRGRLHIDEDMAHVELVPHLRDLDGRMLYRVIGTTLDNWHQPLVRYDTGDLVALADDDHCDCGLPGRIVAEVDGRRDDVIVLADGTRVGRASQIFPALEFVREAQIRQRQPDAVTILVVPRQPWTPELEQRLLVAVRERLGVETRVSIEIHESLPRGPSGKLRLVVREGVD